MFAGQFADNVFSSLSRLKSLSFFNCFQIKIVSRAILRCRLYGGLPIAIEVLSCTVCYSFLSELKPDHNFIANPTLKLD